MIRTVIEVSSEDDYKHKQELHDVLDRLGFEPKESADNNRWRHDLFEALRQNGIDWVKLTEEFRAARDKAQ